ncbi:MAG: hypothetical protein NTW21_29250 [Verrucomicrobia bacterium]|nr:hypothetical protein [Verrucomicrobiota bacterium]
MSLHAQLSPEALARLHAQRRNSSISSLVIAFLSITLMGLVLGFILIPALFKDTPTIVTYAASLTEETDLNEKKINTSADRRPSSPSSSMAKVIAANTTSTVAIPVPDVDTPVPSVNFGDGDDFGTGWGSGGDGGGGGGGFGNIPTTMKKRCSKQDRLTRLKDTGGTPECEEAVVKALQWLKSTQSQDGAWGGSAMTGLGLLAYLGHCETPLSEEFGPSCLLAITNLVNLGMKNNGKLSTDAGARHWPYEHGIATYALAEATTFCKQLNINVPNLQEVTQKAGQLIIDNQHQSGGWDYSYDESGPRGGDLSITAWQMQALKACKHTGLDFRNLSKCVSRGTEYVEKLASGSGGFGYTNANSSAGGDYFTLTGAGMLSLQMWDKGSRAAVRNGAKYIDKNTKFDYNTGFSDLYGHYYEAQAMMNRGGEQWKRYNTLFREQLLKNQNPDGSWKAPGGGQKMRAVAPQFVGDAHFRTCLCTLMLEVYYRFLPGTGGSVQ